MTVIVARRDDTFSQRLRDAGVEVINLELIQTEVTDDLSEFENLMARLDEYDGVFFTSPVAAKVFADRVDAPIRPTLYGLGKRSVSVLAEAGFVVKSVPQANTAEEMLASFGNDEFAGKKLLFIRGERSMRTIPRMLAGVAEVDEIAVYKTLEIDPPDDVVDNIRRRIANGEIESICFFSPSAVEAFEKRFGHAGRVSAIGETTAERARELGFEIGVVASEATNQVFAKELIDRLGAEG